MNLLDDRLSQDRALTDRLAAMRGRLAALADYGRAWGADGVLFTCSAFGPAIEAIAAASPIPVLKPNEAMFDAALAHCAQLCGPRRVGLLTTFAPAAASLREEFTEAAAGREVQLDTACAAGAMDALARGDRELHDRLLLDRARSLQSCDVVLLGQFSMAASRPAVQAALPCPVLTSPDSAVARLRALIDPQPSGDPA